MASRRTFQCTYTDRKRPKNPKFVANVAPWRFFSEPPRAHDVAC